MSDIPAVSDTPASALRPSPILDGLIHQRLVGPVIFMGEGCFTGRHAVPAYSSSMDAASSLITRLLPGWAWRVGSGPDGIVVEVSLGIGTTVRITSQEEGGLHPGLIICIALFSILEAVEHGGEPDASRGAAALQDLLDLPADAFGRRAIEQLDIEAFHAELEIG